MFNIGPRTLPRIKKPYPHAEASELIRTFLKLSTNSISDQKVRLSQLLYVK